MSNGHIFASSFSILALSAILLVSVGCDPIKLPQDENQHTQPENNNPPSETSEILPSGTGDPSSSPVPQSPTSIHPVNSSDIIQVKFREGTDLEPPAAALPPELRDAVKDIAPLTNLTEQELDDIGAGSFRLWFQITLNPGTDAASFMEKLRGLDNIEIVELAPLPPPPP